VKLTTYSDKAAYNQPKSWRRNHDEPGKWFHEISDWTHHKRGPTRRFYHEIEINFYSNLTTSIISQWEAIWIQIVC